MIKALRSGLQLGPADYGDLLARAVPPYAPMFITEPFGFGSNPIALPGSPVSIHGLVTSSEIQVSLPGFHRPIFDFK